MISISNAISIGRPVVSSESFLLDQYGSDVIAAYSVRRLSSTYTGNALRVRRESDDEEIDLGFDSDGNLDTSPISTFIVQPGEDGFVSKWYDQSGNSRDAVQATNSLQFRIVNNRTVVTRNSIPSMEGTSTSNAMNISGIPTTSQPICSFEAYANDGIPNGSIVQLFRGANGAGKTVDVIRFNYATISNVPKITVFTSDGGLNTNSVPTFSAPSDEDIHIVTRIVDTSESLIYLDGISQGPLSSNPVSAEIGGANQEILGGLNAIGFLSEFMLFDSNKSADRVAIEDNMKDYY
jgi:hypothetical protein